MQQDMQKHWLKSSIHHVPVISKYVFTPSLLLLLVPKNSTDEVNISDKYFMHFEQKHLT